jgi:predicted membrane protein (TIGR00267 family)
MLEKYKEYSKITNLWPIVRRYFVNNFYDGMLTVLGILLGFFVTILKDGQLTVASHLIILTGLGSSISMFISGLTGSYLSERAEQKKIKEELDKAMLISEEAETSSEDATDVKEIEKAMFIKLGNKQTLNKEEQSKEKKKKNRTFQEKAENFASIIAAIVNGFSPFLGGVIAILPFLFVLEATYIIFVYSFSLILFCIILLGVFLGVVSRESIIKNILQMVIAFFLTLIISLFLLG